MKRNKNKALFIAILSMCLMVMSLFAIYTGKSQNELIGGIVAFILCGMLGIVAILDYDYLSKKQEL